MNSVNNFAHGGAQLNGTHWIRLQVDRRTVLPLSSVVVAVPTVDWSTSLYWLQYRLESILTTAFTSWCTEEESIEKTNHGCRVLASALFEWLLRQISMGPTTRTVIHVAWVLQRASHPNGFKSRTKLTAFKNIQNRFELNILKHSRFPIPTTDWIGSQVRTYFRAFTGARTNWLTVPC